MKRAIAVVAMLGLAAPAMGQTLSQAGATPLAAPTSTLAPTGTTAQTTRTVSPAAGNLSAAATAHVGTGASVLLPLATATNSSAATR